MTRYGIEYNLKKSPYIYSIEETGITFFFSSNIYKEKFENNFIENRKKKSETLKNKLKIRIDFTFYCDLLLYQKIELRGFLIKYKDIYYDNLDNIYLTDQINIKEVI